jgi:hypothetical protein
VLASATIGPEGGVVAVASGKQAGLLVTVPPGAIAAPTLLRIVDVPVPNVASLSFAPQPGDPVRIEPAELRLEVLGTLRLPYRINAILNTAPGNVLARQVRPAATVDVQPPVVDVANGYIELPLRTLAQFQVVPGPAQERIEDYQQAVGPAVALADGWSFAVEEVPANSPFAGANRRRWRLLGPAGEAEELLDFDDSSRLIGRESVTADWREVWASPAIVWQSGVTGVPVGITTTTQVSSPMSALPIGGLMTAFGLWSWGEPRFVGPQQVYDVCRLRIALAWNRQDLGIGQREYVLSFSPGLGIVALSVDGIVHPRNVL